MNAVFEAIETGERRRKNQLAANYPFFLGFPVVNATTRKPEYANLGKFSTVETALAHVAKVNLVDYKVGTYVPLGTPGADDFGRLWILEGPA